MPDAPAGALVHVHDERGRKLGSALYSSSSQIAIRLISTGEIGSDQVLPLVRDRIAQAVSFREKLPIPRVRGLKSENQEDSSNGVPKGTPLQHIGMPQP